MKNLRISKLLCTFAIELRNMFNQLNFQAMQDDLENRVSSSVFQFLVSKTM